MSQLERLKAKKEAMKKNANSSNMVAFDDILVVNVGVEPIKHYPKLKDSDGNKLKDEKGADKRSDVADGWTYTFAEFGTAKTVKIVLKNFVSLTLLGAYKVSGLGYDIKNVGLVFIEKDSKIETY